MMLPSQTEEQRRRSEELVEAFRLAQARYKAMSSKEKAVHDQAQRESFIQGMGPCEHGDYDWETCPQCLQRYDK